VCGRYVSSRRADELGPLFGAVVDPEAAAREPEWNVAPTDPVPAVLERRRRGAGAPASTGGERGAAEDAVERRLVVARWGLVPSWARDLRGGARLINARLESAPTTPAFRRAFAARRCLLPADGWYEWTPGERGGRQPWLLRPRDGGVLAFAGLYELWWPREGGGSDGPAAPVLSVTVLTTEAVDEAGRVHDRMPVGVEPEGWDAWLDPATTAPEAVLPLLAPAALGRVEAVAVSPEVNNVRARGPGLVRPLPPADAPDLDAQARLS